MKKILIYGYGLEGKSTEKYLTENSRDFEITIFDKNQPEFAQTPNFEKFDTIFVSPGIDRNQIPEPFHKICTSQIEYFFEQIPENIRAKIIGITGSKGKSTTTKFSAEFLERAGFTTQIVGNFGIPFLQALPDILANKFNFIVAEISSYQAEFLQKSPKYTFFVSYFPEHLNRHGSEKNYLAAKANCWKHQRTGDFLFIPQTLQNNVFVNSEISNDNNVIWTQNLSPEYFPETSFLRSEHMTSNLGLVQNLAEILDINNIDNIFKDLRNFQGLPHRLEFFTRKNDIDFYDDSISTNAQSTIAAINFFKDKLGLLILGGQDGGGDFTGFFTNISPHTKVILIQSEISKKVLEQAKKANFTNIIKLDNWQNIAKICWQECPKNMACVLSPAGKSFDFFDNFKLRGEYFKKEIKN